MTINFSMWTGQGWTNGLRDLPWVFYQFASFLFDFLHLFQLESVLEFYSGPYQFDLCFKKGFRPTEIHFDFSSTEAEFDIIGHGRHYHVTTG